MAQVTLNPPAAVASWAFRNWLRQLQLLRLWLWFWAETPWTGTPDREPKLLNLEELKASVRPSSHAPKLKRWWPERQELCFRVFNFPRMGRDTHRYVYIYICMYIYIYILYLYIYLYVHTQRDIDMILSCYAVPCFLC